MKKLKLIRFGAPEIESIEMFNFNGQECYEKIKKNRFC